MLYVGGVAKRCFFDKIQVHDEKQLGHQFGTNLGQQAWESLAILVAVREWKSHWQQGRVELVIRSDNVGAVTAVAKLTAHSPSLLLCARELALEVADGTFAPDVVEHISGVSNVIPDYLSRRFDPQFEKQWEILEALAMASEHSCVVRSEGWWRTAENTAELTQMGMLQSGGP